MHRVTVETPEVVADCMPIPFGAGLDISTDEANLLGTDWCLLGIVSPLGRSGKVSQFRQRV
jgi:hypothetical protein